MTTIEDMDFEEWVAYCNERSACLDCIAYVRSYVKDYDYGDIGTIVDVDLEKLRDQMADDIVASVVRDKK